MLYFTIVPGEYAHEAGYHYYPDLDRVRAWARDAGFAILEDGVLATTISIFWRGDPAISRDRRNDRTRACGLALNRHACAYFAPAPRCARR